MRFTLLHLRWVLRPLGRAVLTVHVLGGVPDLPLLLGSGLRAGTLFALGEVGGGVLGRSLLEPLVVRGILLRLALLLAGRAHMHYLEGLADIELRLNHHAIVVLESVRVVRRVRTLVAAMVGRRLLCLLWLLLRIARPYESHARIRLAGAAYDSGASKALCRAPPL